VENFKQCGKFISAIAGKRFGRGCKLRPASMPYRLALESKPLDLEVFKGFQNPEVWLFLKMRPSLIINN